MIKMVNYCNAKYIGVLFLSASSLIEPLCAQASPPLSQDIAAVYEALGEIDDAVCMTKADKVFQLNPKVMLNEIDQILSWQSKVHSITPYTSFDDPVLKHAVLFGLRHLADGVTSQGRICNILKLEREGKLPKGKQSLLIAEELARLDLFDSNGLLIDSIKRHLFDMECMKLIIQTLDKRMSDEGAQIDSIVNFMSWFHDMEPDPNFRQLVVSVLGKHGRVLASGVDLAARATLCL